MNMISLQKPGCIMKTKITHRLLAAMLSLALITALLPMASFAADGVSYIDANGQTQTVDNVTEITAGTATLSDGWYVVSGNVTRGSGSSDRITVNATGDGAHLILADGCDYTVNGGIQVQVSNKLTIYAQSAGASMGKLTVQNVADNSAGIGGDNNNAGGAITINGGKVTTVGGSAGAGIGGGMGGNITITGGMVTATGGQYSAGIGGGFGGTSGVIIISGGEVTATGGGGDYGGAGIGTGRYYTYKDSDDSSITISGGEVTATGSKGGAG
ncbi:MAG: hypothetical protein LBJ10_03375, partial [Clostridiales bacterium]|nr:hypothetical protein [Clostridiales bacterium]